MKNTGELLKIEREKKKLSINDVSIKTKISPRVLKAIEAGDVDKLPATSFVRGFVKTYAQILEIDHKKVLKVFEEESEEKIQIVSKVEVEEDNSLNKDKPWYEHIEFFQKTSTTSKFIAVGLIIFLIFIIMLVRNLMHKYEQEKNATPQLQQVEPIQESTPEKIEAEPSSEVKQDITPPQPEPSKTEEPPILPTTKTTSELPAEVEKKQNDQKTEATEPNPPKESESSEKEAVKESNNNVENTEPADNTPFQQEVIVEALDFVALYYRIDGGDLKSIDLRPDQLFTIKAHKSIAVDVSDAGAINVIYNGKDKGVAGNIGQEKKLKFP
ncbi:MAG: helix-turn-helix domain-containing protein [Bdellovibrionales bacterium]|nr:helix-turn-helix domain-containing protein [Bdellovibrionales bacterium]